MRKGVLRNFANFTGKRLCHRLIFNKVAGLRSEAHNFIKTESLAQVFSCEFCEISKNTFFTEHLQTTSSGFCMVSIFPSNPFHATGQLREKFPNTEFLLVHILLYSVRIQENTDQKKTLYLGTFPAVVSFYTLVPFYTSFYTHISHIPAESVSRNILVR